MLYLTKRAGDVISCPLELGYRILDLDLPFTSRAVISVNILLVDFRSQQRMRSLKGVNSQEAELVYNEKMPFQGARLPSGNDKFLRKPDMQ